MTHPFLEKDAWHLEFTTNSFPEGPAVINAGATGSERTKAESEATWRGRRQNEAHLQDTRYRACRLTVKVA